MHFWRKQKRGHDQVTQANADVGLECVRWHYRRAQVDEEWSLWDDRGYTWWGHRLAQRVWSEPPVEIEGEKLWLLRAEVDLVRNVKVETSKVLAVLAAANAIGLLGSLVFYPEQRKIKLACSFGVTAEFAPAAREPFSWAAAIQVALAECELGERLPMLVEGELDVTSSRSSGLRPEPDNMLDMLPAVKAMSLAAQMPVAELFERFKGLPDGPSVLTTCDERQLTAEFLYEGYTGLMRDIFGPEGKPHTALFRVAAGDEHPLLGAGLYLRLVLPVCEPSEQAAHVANQMNIYERITPALLDGVGAWCLDSDPQGSGCHLSHVIFLPGVLCRTTSFPLVMFLYAWRHMCNARDVFKLKPPPPIGPEDVKLEDLVKEMQAIREIKHADGKKDIT